MCRPFVAATAAAVLTACGSSSNTGSSGAGPPLSGSMFGQSFTPADSTAITPGQGSCSLASVTASATGLSVRFGSFQGLCSLMTTQGRTCGSRANTTVVTLLLVSAKRDGTAAPIQPGTYNITASIPTPDAQGIIIAEGFAAKTEDCTKTPSASYTRSGTITITEIGSNVTGSADVTFSDGGHVSGSFSAPVCSPQVDACTLLGDLSLSCVAQLCVP